jgi:hypothetical protein
MHFKFFLERQDKIESTELSEATGRIVSRCRVDECNVGATLSLVRTSALEMRV